jgi:hypothetical protein
MKSITKIAELLEDALKSARMESAGFGGIHHPEITLHNRDEVDAFVKEQVRLYMRTWVAGPIEHALTILNANKELLAASDNLINVAWKDSVLIPALDRMRTAVDAAGRIE